MKFTLLFGRILFSLIFLMAGLAHFSSAEIGYAASLGLPAASFLVPASGVISFLGALSITLGYKAKWGAWLIVIFLIPVTLMFHNFWAVTDPIAKQLQMSIFMKNISMMGAALMIAYLGTGPLSLDARPKLKTAS